MGNEQFKTTPPKAGEKYVITDIPYTIREKITKDVYGQGTEVVVLESKNLYCSRPEATQVTFSKVRFPGGRIDAYPSISLRKV